MMLTFINSVLIGLCDLCTEPVHNAYDMRCTNFAHRKLLGQ